MHFHELKDVDVSHTTIDDEQVLRLTDLQSLTFLTILDTPVTPDCMGEIRARRPGLVLLADEWKRERDEHEDRQR